MTIDEKEKALTSFFENHKKVIIAFSGGADSALLAAAAAGAATSPDTDALAVTVKTELVSDREIQNARDVANEIGITHIFIDKKILELPEIENNRKNRCYVCKKEILTTLLEYAKENGYETVVEGTNYSDVLMNEANEIPRPGFSFISEQKEIQRKRKEANQKSGAVLPKLQTPLADLKIIKEEVRELLKKRKLSVAEKPSMSCLATRFSYDSKLNPVLLKTVDRAEEMLSVTGAKQIRIRCHTDSAGRNIARVEVGIEDGKVFFDAGNQKIIGEFIEFLKANGFSYVTADLEGFRSGSMDI
ncbi:Pyridinium-3,5-bisthiocarboxylic acid mononucleotide synthase [Methanimicrococcus stummii]|uniref:Pyridinium-3,5-bisthiocarboxylic acid mononucleotide synthase n=1 Tax=Methanimicrococcus stummii TaxID=3028294 RepID=A0AA96ZXT3_9EURY|nr:ATP-dependent sacrificial sulfur transferase LarE [Methanimicrococcus sp. Es2]WNY29329.1 Pyridinium-3,5-bisthiocarboxylic acid mononucleotide synthase [Methanimicrococcus sp. Es2]